MNEEISGDAYKDRSTGLIVFGVLTILLGCLAGLFVLLLLGQAMFVKMPQRASLSAMLPAIFVYGILAVALVWLGIGSTLARRWSRALLLIFSWSWLMVGVVTLFFMGFLMPKIFANIPAGGTNGQPPFHAPPIAMMMAVMLLVLGIFFVVVPFIWIFFYQSRHVKATCEARDPVPRWTDDCPLPVLAVCLWLMLSAPMMLLMPLAGHGVMPFFGMFLSGLPGAMLCLTVAALWSYAAWSLYKLEQKGWWVIFIGLCVFMVSTLLTFMRNDMTQMYVLMGYPKTQIEQIQTSGLLSAGTFGWLITFSFVTMLGYLLYIRKFLRQ